jgi:hypothetical protein
MLKMTDESEQRERYEKAKREYKAEGRKLAEITGRKPKK